MENPHPYYPLGVVIPGYFPNESPLAPLLAVFAFACCFTLALAWGLTKLLRPDLPRSEVLIVLWFALCSFIHLTFESYFLRHWNTLASQQGVYGQLWKEYAQSDSRYLSQDLSVLCLETMAVTIWGPLSLITAYMILASHPMRHGLQIIISMGHLISVTLYYITSLIELWFMGSSHSRPEFLYFWVYFVGTNAAWAIVPAILLRQSLKEIARLSRLSSDIPKGQQNGKSKRRNLKEH